MYNLKEIEIFGDKFKIRKTYDIEDRGIGCYGFDIFGENNKFLYHFVGEDFNELKSYIKANFYKNYESTYSYHK